RHPRSGRPGGDDAAGAHGGVGATARGGVRSRKCGRGRWRSRRRRCGHSRRGEGALSWEEQRAVGAPGGAARRRRTESIVNNFGRNLALWVIVALLLVALFNLFQPAGVQRGGAREVAYSDFLNDVNAGRLREVIIQGRTVTGHGPDGTVRAYTPEDPGLVGRLTEKGVR